ncbi:hypothetical protein EW146_g5366 [Bondarzewia mesenterica]|uniref:Uncharacterized protein n=1 Tax=Bondarzewia mesenterica TaxID=1095465 RepID=A0A4S4LSC3_9AGAM|nr:hypothetical protein EW146_g5366 [Bondarzewia mesenterica]
MSRAYSERNRFPISAAVPTHFRINMSQFPSPIDILPPEVLLHVFVLGFKDFEPELGFAWHLKRFELQHPQNFSMVLRQDPARLSSDDVTPPINFPTFVEESGKLRVNWCLHQRLRIDFSLTTIVLAHVRFPSGTAAAHLHALLQYSQLTLQILTLEDVPNLSGFPKVTLSSLHTLNLSYLQAHRVDFLVSSLHAPVLQQLSLRDLNRTTSSPSPFRPALERVSQELPVEFTEELCRFRSVRTLVLDAVISSDDNFYVQILLWLSDIASLTVLGGDSSLCLCLWQSPFFHVDKFSTGPILGHNITHLAVDNQPSGLIEALAYRRAAGFYDKLDSLTYFPMLYDEVLSDRDIEHLRETDPRTYTSRWVHPKRLEKYAKKVTPLFRPPGLSPMAQERLSKEIYYPRYHES